MAIRSWPLNSVNLLGLYGLQEMNRSVDDYAGSGHAADETTNFIAPNLTPGYSVDTHSSDASEVTSYNQYNQVDHLRTYPPLPPPQGEYFLADSLSSSNKGINSIRGAILQDDQGTFYMEPESYPSIIEEPHGYRGPFNPPYGSSYPVPLPAVPLYELRDQRPESEDSIFSIARSVEEVSPTEFSPQNRSKTGNKTICQLCSTTFSRPADLKRHDLAKHGNAMYFCGCCNSTKHKRFFNRKDKLLEHKRKYHGYKAELEGSSLRTCEHDDCIMNEDQTFFCTEAGLERHMSLSHGIQFLGKHNDLPEDTNTLGSIFEGSMKAEASGSTTNTKRPRQDDSFDTPKRPKVEQSATESGRDLAHIDPLVLSQVMYSPCTTSGHPSVCPSGIAILSNVCLSDIIWLSKPTYSQDSRTDFRNVLLERLRRVHISFDIVQRKLNIRGCDADTRDIKLRLEELLSQHRHLRYLPVQYEAAAALRCFGHRFSKGPKASQHNKKKIFTMSRYEHSDLLDKWHQTILPFLPKILSSKIGNNFSVVLVRKGWSAEATRFVVQIQCPSSPSTKVKESIRSQVLGYSGGALAAYNTKVDFIIAPFTLLAGDEAQIELDDSSEEDEEEGEYPYYQCYWRRPGMGASVGLECSNKVSATLGCYVIVDNKSYILTVQHFIPKSHTTLIEGKSAALKLVSPPPVEVEAMREALEQVIRNIDHEFDTWAKENGRNELFQGDFDLLPELIRVLCWKQAVARQHLNEILPHPSRDPNHFILGSVEYQSRTPNEDAQENPSGSNEIKPDFHMDWALCTVFDDRKGLNRHRYFYNHTTKLVDFHEGDVDGYGAGDFCSETGPVEKNAKVHYVGQSTGRQQGEVSAAKALVVLDGRKTLEWTILPDAPNQMDDKKYRGDSGASVIQDSDNKLIGHLWACHAGGSLVFTPIEAVFEDIRKQLKAKRVCLPPPPRAILAPSELVSNVIQICRVEKKPVKRIPLSKMQGPGPWRPQVMLKEPTSMYKHSIEFMLGLEPEKLKKHWTMPAIRHKMLDSAKLRRSKGTWPTVSHVVRAMNTIWVS